MHAASVELERTGKNPCKMPSEVYETNMDVGKESKIEHGEIVGLQATKDSIYLVWGLQERTNSPLQLLARSRNGRNERLRPISDTLIPKESI
jgi:hypothetical protein